MERRGGRWRTAATILNVAKATDNLVCGIHNLRAVGGINGQVRQATGYTGPIVWSH
jgi:hypothetical protein